MTLLWLPKRMLIERQLSGDRFHIVNSRLKVRKRREIRPGKQLSDAGYISYIT